MEYGLDSLQQQIPYYLTAAQQDGLRCELREFFDGKKINYYTSICKYDVLQGDGWSGLSVYNFFTGNKKEVKGIVLSNTCDISPVNVRQMPSKVVFAPIVKLNSYLNALKSAGSVAEQVDSKYYAIKLQSVTSLFYLPKGGALDEEYVAVLDDVHSIPYQCFSEAQGRSKQFTLSMAGFYLFLFKLSIHFCRFHEGIDRDEYAEA